jgi:hypothetical protein
MERRRNRSAMRHEAMAHYLESLRQQQHLGAVGLATEQGLLVAGSGEGDLDRMAAVAASSRARSVRWEEEMVHVHRFEALGVPLLLASTGKAVKGHGPLQRITRILAS